jgi:hypothetical protein
MALATAAMLFQQQWGPAARGDAQFAVDSYAARSLRSIAPPRNISNRASTVDAALQLRYGSA